MPRPQLIDVNVVLGPWPMNEAEALSPETLIAQLDRLGIERALVRHSDSILYDADEGNRRVVSLTAAHPRLMPAFVVVPLDGHERDESDDLVRSLDRHDVAAVWLYPRSHGWSVDGPEATSLIEQLSLAARPVFVDLDECDWDGIAWLAAALPSIDIVVCSAGYRTLRQACAVMERHPRVHVDTSYLSATDALELITERLGDGRVVFGSGSPIRDGGGAVFRLERSGLPESSRESVGTAAPRALLTSVDGDAATTAVALDVPDYGIVDAHAHIGRWPSSWVPRPDAEHLIASMDHVETEISIISSMAAIWTGSTRDGNQAAYEAARQYPGRLYVHAVANPNLPSDLDYLDEFLQRDEVRGIKVHPHTHGCALDASRYEWIWELAIRHGVPVLGHSFGQTWHSDPSLFGTVARRHPELTLVAGHAGATPAGFVTALDAAQESENIVAEICGSYMTGWWLRRFVDALGPHRILYGTDATLIDPRYGMGRVLAAPLDDSERQAIMSTNARRLYGLPDPGQRAEPLASSVGHEA